MRLWFIHRNHLLPIRQDWRWADGRVFTLRLMNACALFSQRFRNTKTLNISCQNKYILIMDDENLCLAFHCIIKNPVRQFRVSSVHGSSLRTTYLRLHTHHLRMNFFIIPYYLCGNVNPWFSFLILSLERSSVKQDCK